MAKTITLQAEPRTLLGRKVKQLRRAGLIPANIYGNKIKSQSIKITLSEFNKVFEEAGETSLVDLTVDGDKKTKPVLITNIQHDPITDKPIHADFHQVDLTQKVTANIPLEITGESPAVKEGGVLLTPLTEIEVEALPTDLPDNIQIDISKLLKTGDSISVSDLKVSPKVELKADPKTPVVLIQEQKAEEEPEPTPAEAEVEGKDGETPAEGDDPKDGDSKDETKNFRGKNSYQDKWDQ